jgi:hypothetical protein
VFRAGATVLAAMVYVNSDLALLDLKGRAGRRRGPLHDLHVLPRRLASLKHPRYLTVLRWCRWEARSTAAGGVIRH